ncbi:GGDEF domain-containing phosphodiesterase [Actinomadura sp. HBU206391]|uniref:GGDEF domain-containing phosphodiesterase n=1 Tax=Actinomadura sp. HBU206391 TaxID=2731692 RepID=UPI0016508F40|nr:GGDEF domain-containing phosphodiesterase [Actinomadura sp. HBU206391]MBC6459961.1 EAL domain-containing protein [Actinomadura sp. HBU206391]
MSADDSRRLLRRALPAGAVAAVGLLFILSSLFGEGSAMPSWATAFVAAAAAGSLFHAARRRTDASPESEGTRIRRDSWRWFGVAALCWCVGAVINAVSAVVLSDAVASLSLADLFFLAAVVALATGFLILVRTPGSARQWLRFVADTYVLVCAVFVIGWVALFGGLYHESGESPPEFFLELLYPLVDVTVVCATLAFALGAARGSRRSTAVAYGALLMVAVADIVTTVVRLRGGATPGYPGEAVRIAGLLLLGAVPWTEERLHADPAHDAADPAPAAAEAADAGGADATPHPRGTDEIRSRMSGLGIAVAAATAAGAVAVFLAARALTGSHELDPIVEVVIGSAVVVVLVRLAELLWENHWLRRSFDTGEEHFRALAESINDVVLICGLDGTVEYVSAGAQRTFSYRPDELLGRLIHEIVHPEDLPKVESVFASFLDGERDPTAPPADGHQDTLRLACRMRAADGTWLPTESTISPYAHAGEERGGRLLVTTRDLSEQAALRRQVTHLTFHDGLTGLPNRAYFEERAGEVLSHRREGGRVAVLFADLDGFTAVNDSAGHAAGDQVLAQAARRLRAAVQAEDTVARWGGDEFAVIVENAVEARPVIELAERLLRVLSAEPYRVGTRGIVLTASIGVAFAGEDGGEGGGDTDKASDLAPRGRRMSTDPAELMRNGDLAMARAKERGGGRVEIFAAHMHADVVRRLELGSDLQRALAEEQFAVEFQPVVELATSRVTGVEALVRWWRGSVSVPPEEFIGPAEESGLMIPLGNWVLREACGEVARWRESSWDIGLSVNLAARQVAAPRFVETVAEVLEETGLPPHALTLEVKEEVLVEDAGQNVQRLSALRDLGVRLAIDDFGTGYASLAYLGQLPVDMIKIDPSFVAGLGRDETLTLLTRTIVRLGHDLGLIVVAEGIERPEQLELLREMGCPRGQGFLVARPMTPGRAQALVRTNLTPPAGQGGASIPLSGAVGA